MAMSFLLDSRMTESTGENSTWILTQASGFWFRKFWFTNATNTSNTSYWAFSAESPTKVRGVIAASPSAAQAPVREAGRDRSLAVGVVVDSRRIFRGRRRLLH